MKYQGRLPPASGTQMSRGYCSRSSTRKFAVDVQHEVSILDAKQGRPMPSECTAILSHAEVAWLARIDSIIHQQLFSDLVPNSRYSKVPQQCAADALLWNFARTIICQSKHCCIC